MTTTLVAVAQRAKARFFLHEGPGRGLTEIEDRVHPSARAANRDVDTDRPGRVHDSFGRHHPLERHESSKEHAAQEFAREIASVIAGHRVRGEIGRVVLVAEPRFLGLVRAALDAPTARLVDGEVAKELTDFDAAAIGAAIGGVLAV